MSTPKHAIPRHLLIPRWLLSLAIGAALCLPPPAEARREMLAPADKARLQQIARVYVETLALTDSGPADATSMARAVEVRLADIGFQAGHQASDPHDVTLKVKCEEHKTWEGTTTSGGDADSVGGIARLWRGPACQLSYRMEGLKSDWRHEVRGDLPKNNGPRAPGSASPGNAALAVLTDHLTQDPFPLLLAAEWGHASRLLSILDRPDTDAAQKTMVITLLGGMAAPDAMPALARAVNDPHLDVANAAAIAIGAIGHQDGIPLLLSLFKQGRPELHLAAAQGLGRLAPLYPQTDLVSELVAALPQSPIPVQVEIVRALATTADRRSYQAIRQLNREVQARSRLDASPELQTLKNALGVAIDQFTNTHGSED